MTTLSRKNLSAFCWRILAACGAMALAACGGGGGGGSSTSNSNPYGITATGPGVLSVSPLDTSTLVWGTPLGYLAPPGHVLPTDHVYLFFVDPWGNNVLSNDCSPRPVYAAGSGVVTFILQTEAPIPPQTVGDTKVMVQMTTTFMYYYDHVLLLPHIKVGTKVNAGEQIATTTGRCPSIDLGVYDLDVTPPGYLNPARYGEHGAHTVSPYKYFSEPLRSLYYSRIRVMEGVPANKDGRVDYGIRGRLSGDWFHSSIANAPSSVSSGPEGWQKSISFAYDWYDGTPRISVGGTIAPSGVLKIKADAPDPATVGTANGIVAYEGTPTMGNIGAGWMLVQMLSDDRIKVQYFRDATSRPTGFTNAAHEYVR